MVLDDFQTTLAEADLGLPVFAGDLPPDPALCLAVFEYNSLPPIMGYDPTASVDGRLIEQPLIQVMGRGDPYGYQVIRAIVERALNVLAPIHNMTINGTRYIRIAPNQSPMLIGRDELLRPLISVNFTVLKEPTYPA